MLSGKRQDPAENQVVELAAHDGMVNSRRSGPQLLEREFDEPPKPSACSTLQSQARIEFQVPDAGSGDLSKPLLEILHTGE